MSRKVTVTITKTSGQWADEAAAITNISEIFQADSISEIRNTLIDSNDIIVLSTSLSADGTVWENVVYQTDIAIAALGASAPSHTSTEVTVSVVTVDATLADVGLVEAADEPSE